MCGFLLRSNYHSTIEYSRFSSALRLISYRGPDNSQIISSKQGIFFGHNRLSILDLSAASAQPITRDNNILVFNGEIYNYKELASYLASTYAVSFVSQGDSEVLLLGLMLENEDFLSKVDGMYSFCYYDQSGSVYLGRDLYGQKPLFYSFIDNELTACSELQPIIDLLNSSPKVNQSAFRDYLLYGASVAPNTLYDGIFSLVPGHILKIDDLQSSFPKKYLIPIQPKKSSRDFITNFESSYERLLTSSDVPIVLLCSGGIDSSFTCLSSLRFTHSDTDLKLLHLRTFDDPIGTKISTKISKITSLQLHINDFHKSSIDVGLEALASSIISRFSEPFADTSYFSTRSLFNATPSGYKVLVGGDGADEIFSGYKPAILFAAASIISLLFPIKTRLFLLSIFSRFQILNNKYIRSFCGEISSIESIIFGINNEEISVLMPDSKSPTPKHKIFKGPNEIISYYKNYLHLRLSNVFLRKSDHASMECSKELRSPFLSPFLYKVRPYTIINLFLKKLPLTFYLLKYLHPLELFRPKVGFEVNIPYSKSLIIQEIKQIIRGSSIISNLFPSLYLDQYILENASKRFVWRFYLLLVWLQRMEPTLS